MLALFIKKQYEIYFAIYLSTRSAHNGNGPAGAGKFQLPPGRY